MEARSSKSRCLWSHTPSELAGRDLFHHHLLQLVALSLSWIANVSLHTDVFMAFSLLSYTVFPFRVSVSVSRSPTFNKDTSHTGLGPP